MRDIRPWLESLGLAHLAPTFEAARIDLDLLAELTDVHLRELGIAALGDRMRLNKAIAELRPPPPVGAERRQVTVLDVALAETDPAAVRAAAAEAGGHVGGDGGDAMTIHFGFPRAQEDAADRAVRLGLALRAAWPKVRVGIVSGEATIETGAAAPAGEVPRRAAALRALAGAGDLLIAEATRARAGPGFVYRAIDRRRLGDLAELGPVWQVLGREAVASRFKAERDGRLAPLVGRQRELDFLIERWRQTKAGEGQVVLVGGEAGIGKSRLVEALIERLSADKPVVFRYQAVAALSNTALHAMAAQVERVSRFQFGDDDATKLAKLRAAMVPEALDEEDFAALAGMLALPLPGPVLSPDERKRRVFKAIAAQLLAVARRSPTLIVLEDAHWLDQTSIELNDMVAELIRDQPVMMLVTHRPGFALPWVEHGNVTAIELGTLNAGEAAQLLGGLVGGRLPPAVMRRILARGEGNPLYLEELARTVLQLQSPSETGAGVAVPATLRELLQARIDLLGRAKPLALAAAAIGREWSVDLARAVLGLDAPTLEAQLQALGDAGLAYPVADAAVPTWTFKHALVRDAAYAAVPPEQRRRLHTSIATVIRDRFGLLAAQRPELLAQHYTAAENWPQAVAGWRAAAAQANAGSSHAEAMSNARRGLELLHRLDDPAARAAGELELRLVLGLGYQAMKGFADPAVEIELGRAWRLAGDVGDDEQRAEILGGLFSFYFIRGDLRRAREQAEAGIAVARRAGAPDRLASARAELGNAMFWQGDFVGANAELADCAEALERIDNFRFTQGQWDPRVNVHAYRSWTLWMLGRPAEGQASAARAVAEAAALRQPFVASLALLWSFYTLHACGLFDAAAARLAELRKISDARNFPFWRARCRAAEARLCLDRGQVADAAALLDEFAGLTRASGAAPDRAWQMAIAAEVTAAQGEPATALRLLDDALAAAQAKQELHWLAELHRLRARLLPDPEAEAALEQALTAARRQQARSLELRAATDLARRRCKAGDDAAARALLRPVLDAFADDGGDRGVAAARALLDRLG